MDDDRVWQFEESLWTGDAEHYRASIDEACLMVLPMPPHVFGGDEAVAAVSDTPRWTTVALADRRIARPEEGLIVVAYHVEAHRGDERYAAHCTSTYRRRGHDDWQWCNISRHHRSPSLDRYRWTGVEGEEAIVIEDAGIEARRREIAVEHVLFQLIGYVEERHPGLLDMIEQSLAHLGDPAKDASKDDEAVREIARKMVNSARSRPRS